MSRQSLPRITSGSQAGLFVQRVLARLCSARQDCYSNFAGQSLFGLPAANSNIHLIATMRPFHTLLLLLLTITLATAATNNDPGRQGRITMFRLLAQTNTPIALLGVDLGSTHMSVQSSPSSIPQSSRQIATPSTSMAQPRSLLLASLAPKNTKPTCLTL